MSREINAGLGLGGYDALDEFEEAQDMCNINVEHIEESELFDDFEDQDMQEDERWFSYYDI